MLNKNKFEKRSLKNRVKNSNTPLHSNLFCTNLLHYECEIITIPLRCINLL